MEKDKYNFLGDSYIERKGSEEKVSQFTNAIQDGKVGFVLSTKIPHPSRTPSVKLTKKNLKKYISK